MCFDRLLWLVALVGCLLHMPHTEMKYMCFVGVYVV